jgi:O-antigen ligase
LVLAINIPTQQVSDALMQLPSAPGLARRAPCAAWIAAGMPRGVQPGDPEYDPATGPDSDLGAVNRLLEGQTLASRWVSYRQAWDDFSVRPFLGNGPNSFGQKYTTTAHTPGWISNLVLMSLHDTGIIGTLILFVWIAWIALRTLRALRAPPLERANGDRAALRTMVLGLGIGLLCLFVAYQVTTMLWFGLVWFLLAVLEAGTTALYDE